MGMPKWVTISEAIKLTGKSENTIRRLIYDLQKANRELAAKILHKTSTGAYQIEEDFLYSKYPPLSTSGQPKANKAPTHQGTQELDPIIKAKDETIAILKSQLEKQAADFKEQLHKRDEQMKMALERMRENNIIIQQLALPSPQLALPSPQKESTTIEPLEVVKGTQESNHEVTHDVPMGNSSGQPKHQNMGTKHKQAKTSEKQKPKVNKQPKSQEKKGFFSFFRRKS
jgi:hypothetical protein